MTKKDLLRILIRLSGIYILIQAIIGAIQLITLFVAYGNVGVWIMLGYGVIVALIILIILFPDPLINIFRLSKGFDDNDINITIKNTTDIIVFAIVIVGGFFILYNFAPLLINIGFSIKSALDKNQYTIASSTFDYELLIIHTINIAIGYLLITNCKTVASWIMSVNYKNEK